jgi:hypothetical protein
MTLRDFIFIFIFIAKFILWFGDALTMPWIHCINNNRNRNLRLFIKLIRKRKMDPLEVGKIKEL